MKVRLPKDKYSEINDVKELIPLIKEPVIAATQQIMDRLIDNIDLEGYDLKEIKENEPSHIVTARDAVNRYQKIIDKLKSEENELEEEDYNSIVLICKTSSIIFENHAKAAREAALELDKIAWKIAHMSLSSKKMETILRDSKNLT